MTSITLWLDREKEQLDPRLFSERAERLAKEIAKEGRNRQNKSSQLRRYFDEIVRLNTLAQSQDCDEELDLLSTLLTGLKLLEHDALGGSGSRGYGRVRFRFDDQEIQQRFNDAQPFAS